MRGMRNERLSGLHSRAAKPSTQNVCAYGAKGRPPMQNSKASRIEALRTIANEVQLLPDEDLARVMKLVKTELKARHAISDITAEINGDEVAAE